MPAHLFERVEHTEVLWDLDGVLREMRDPHRRAALDAPGARLELAREQPHERGLARSVDADDRDAVAWAETPRELVQHGPGAERE